MKHEITITFAELKNATVRMRALVKRTLGEDSTARTSFHDLGVAGLDWDSFLDEYYQEFGIELVGLRYEDYFTEGISDLTITDILLFPYRLARMIVLSLSGQYKQYQRKSTLTAGDLILSVHAGRFIKREETRISLCRSF